jgi:hypothetical protein
MVSNEHEIVLGVPAAEVFAWVADLDGWHRWRPSEGRLEPLTPGPVGVGTTWEAAGRGRAAGIARAIEGGPQQPATPVGGGVGGGRPPAPRGGGRGVFFVLGRAGWMPPPWWSAGVVRPWA